MAAHLSAHALLKEVHQLSLERHASATHVQALQAQVAALEANLADAARMHAALQAKVQVLEYGLKIERKHNARLVAVLSASAANGVSADAGSAATPALAELLEDSVDPALHDAYMAALPRMQQRSTALTRQAAFDESLPRPLPGPAALGATIVPSSPSSSSSFSSSGLSNATSALPSSAGADEGDVNFSYTRTGGGGMHRQRKSRGGGGGGVDVNATSALPSGKPPSLTANTFMPPSEEEIAAEIALAKSPPGQVSSLGVGLGAGAGRGRADSNTVSFSYSTDDGESARKAAADASPSGDPSAPSQVFSYDSSPESALPSFGAASSAAGTNGTTTTTEKVSSIAEEPASDTSDLRLGQTAFDLRAGDSFPATASSSSASSGAASATTEPASEQPASAAPASSSNGSSSIMARHARGASSASGTGTGSLAGAIAGGLLTSAKQWRPKLQLKSHMDSVRSVCFDRNRLANLLSSGNGAPPTLLLSGSEDGTAQLWNLSAALSAAATSRKAAGLPQPSPLHAYRGHLGTVTSVLLHSAVGAFSAGVDGQVIQWALPAGAVAGLPVDLYAQHGRTDVFARRRMKHADAVWGMDLYVSPAAAGGADSASTAAGGAADGDSQPVATSMLAAAAANGEVCLWDVEPSSEEEGPASESSEPRLRLRVEGDEHVPTAVQFLPSSGGHVLAVGYSTGALVLFDTKSGAEVSRCVDSSATAGGADATGAASSPSRVTSLVSHPSQGLLVSAHVDSSIRFWDVSSPAAPGRVGVLAAHRGVVSCVSLDGGGSHLVSCSHDESIRVWATEERKIRQVLDTHQTHRLKFQEAIHCVHYHPTQPVLASAGADGIVKLYV